MTPQKLQEIAGALRALADAIEPADEPVEEARAPEPEAEEKTEPDPERLPPLTLESVREQLSDFVKAGRSADVKAALSSLGVSKLSELEESQYAALLEAIGRA
ncbi:hypothetical protein HMPREF0058_0730 [Actinomyces urogenitalis DSM 15434]|uniref:rRNA biogenesis protein rrp5 n=1 Tax=Actinomyces urogenitalis DSM 15434 TaxID=525246 RepID=C0W4D6_9ACTO|nr:hypothetical protein [Actinomyces urogenitalis]EEH66419.1 hypothetical protein HMPREF0058_0730 [Actinomyces urogenitalis DSM 15434]MBS5976848.1 hypothetical protein [Actinomyces urogenitalis]